MHVGFAQSCRGHALAGGFTTLFADPYVGFEPCWRTQVSDAVTEARDVLKYLRVLEPSWELLYTGSVADVRASLHSLLGNVYRMHTVARWHTARHGMA